MLYLILAHLFHYVKTDIIHKTGIIALPSEEKRMMATGNVYRKFGCVFFEMTEQRGNNRMLFLIGCFQWQKKT